ncbi:MAG: 2-deoxy-5-keto-D-gluconate 6-phosphate aldolase domain-containing protein [Acidimicrobiia bacterium]
MGLGYEHPLFMFALDHRVPPHQQVFGVTADPTPAETARVVDAKSVIFDGFTMALEDGAPVAEAGVLVDEQFGADVARTALARGWICAMPVERSGIGYFDVEYGEDFAAHVEEFDPTFSKALVRYNPGGDAANNERSRTGLARLSDWMRATGRKLLLELIVLAEPDQLATVDGDVARYDTELRPALMRRSIADFQDAGIEADVWKLEGIDRRDDCTMISEQARAGGRDRVGCVILGRGANTAKVEHWLRTAAGVPGFLGFAIGRTIWGAHVAAYLDGSLTREEAARRIAASYRRAISVHQGAE